MLISDFTNEFNTSIDNNDIISANNSLMRELGNILVLNREDFVHLLQGSDVYADMTMSDAQLVHNFIVNVPTNKKLMLGASMLVNIHNKQAGFDGENEMSDEGVKLGYKTMKSFFTEAGETSEDFANVGGGILGSISQIVQSGGDVAKKALEGQQMKKGGAMMLATKQADAKAEMTKQILAQRQAEIEAKKTKATEKSKTTKTLLIVGASVLGLAIIGTAIYFIKKKK